MNAPLTVAAVQCSAIFDDVAATSAHVLACARAAVAAGARLIVFPEAYLHGHSYLSAPVASRARTVDDPEIVALVQALAPMPITAVIGFFERRGALIHNSAMVIADGQILGCYAKHDPREAGCTPGTERPLFPCDDWPFAISICRDTRSQALALDFAAQGARLFCYPLNNMLPPDVAAVNREMTLGCHVDRARETGCWVISADVVGAQEGWVAHGNTRVIDPTGEMVAEVPANETGMVIVTIG